MSNKKPGQSRRRKAREVGKQDFKKVSPKDLEKMGYSKSAERYIPPKNFDKTILDKKGLADYERTGTISKRKQAQAVFGLTNEEKARKIKAGKRPILSNAPKKARQAKIVSAFKKREEASYKRPTKRKLSAPVNIKGFKSGAMRYDYYLGHSLDAIAYGVISQVMRTHSPDATSRIVVQVGDDARTSESFMLRRADEMIPEFIDDLEQQYSFLQQNEPGMNTGFIPPEYYLYVYELA